MMDLDKHFINFQNKDNILKATKEQTNYSLDIIWFIQNRRRNWQLENILKKGERHKAVILRKMKEDGEGD